MAETPLKRVQVWIVTDGKKGTENQCLGLAERLQDLCAETAIIDITIKKIQPKWPWNILSPTILPRDLALSEKGDSLDPPYPDMIIGSGRHSVGSLVVLKRLFGSQTMFVQIQDPKAGYKDFDMIISPSHDCLKERLKGDTSRILQTVGALSRVTLDKILADVEATAARFPKADDRKYVAVLIGGKSKAHSMESDLTERLCGQLLSLTENYPVHLLITASRRTGEENSAILTDKLAGKPHIDLWDNTGDNPFFGFLGLGEWLLVTSDSVSMPSEALTTGKPTYIIDLPTRSNKFRRFHTELQRQGYTRLFQGKMETWTVPKLDETGRAASEVIRRFPQLFSGV